jgi:2-polyprenyl-3-methyl-5-hydroxy-6-metoxy-1,4-benzoquinol methylase
VGLGGKYTEFDTALDSVHNLVVRLVPPGSRVLEFGCATGYMSEVLRGRLGCSVTGIEISAEASEMARKHCVRVIGGDAESLDFQEVLGGDRFDIILFADVLEHLREPGAVLWRVRPFLAEGGSIVASIPNIAHGSVRLALLSGEFRYRDVGLLDNTHLRFFTRESIQDLFEGAGYVIMRWLRRRVEIDRTEIGLPVRPVPDVVRDWIAMDPDATTYQYIVVAESTGAGEALRRVRGELTTAAAEAAKLTTAAAELERMNGVLTLQNIVNNIVPTGETFILVDEDQWGGGEPVPDRRAIPFLERDGQYWGPPADDETAIRELQRLVHEGAGFIVFAWPAFWWFEYYSGLARHLRSTFRCVLQNERAVVFDLRSRGEQRVRKIRGSGN